MRKGQFQVLVGDALGWLRQLATESVQCCITSPPYWALRDYHGHPGQLGSEPTFDAWVAGQVELFREVRRVLRKDGTLWLNVGRSYAGARSFEGKVEGTDGVFGRRSARLDSTGLPLEGEKPGRDPAFKESDLVMQGHLLAEALRRDGWWLRSDNVWWKNAMPESTTSRPSNTHENVFLLTKSRDYFYDAEAVRTKAVPGKSHGMGTKGRAREMVGGVDEFAVRKQAASYDYSGTANLRTVWEEKDADEFLRLLWIEYLEFAAERLSAMGDVWRVNNEPFPGSHFAVFSTALVERCVRAGTSEKGCCPICAAPWERTVTKGEPDLAHRAACGADASGGYNGTSTKDHVADGVQDASAVKARILEGMRKRTSTWAPGCAHRNAAGQPFDPVPCMVLDCFGGSGRTGKVAVREGRDALLIELVPEYAAMAEENVSDPEWEKKTRARIRLERLKEDAKIASRGEVA